MPTKHPRIHVVLERPLYERLKKMAKCSGLSLSLEARALIRSAMDGERTKGAKAFTGKHFRGLIGAFRSNKRGSLDDTLAAQVHG